MATKRPIQLVKMEKGITSVYHDRDRVATFHTPEGEVPDASDIEWVRLNGHTQPVNDPENKEENIVEKVARGSKENLTSLSCVIQGLQILSHYYDYKHGKHITATTDNIVLYPTDRPVLEQDKERLYNLGWFQANVPAGSYYQKDNWTCYV